ncbi:MAG TPA: efflux RND transporter periplasmic adaptor subunit [Phycisphaerales bacterium]|nr:efflux RND transporter periplasmic adaptor subunit [Phycisphaerales bacterium]
MRQPQKVIGIMLAVLALGVGGYFGIVSLHARNADQTSAAAFEPTEATEIVAAREIEWQATADLVGTVVAMRSVVVRNELAGVVRYVGFESGTTVEPEQILLRQDDAMDRADLDAVKASVRVAEANVAEVDSEIKLAESELARMSTVQSRAVAEVDLDRARTKLETAKTERARWEAEADQAKARVAQVEARLAKLTIQAPFRARVGLRTVHEGQYLAEGTEVAVLQELTDTIYLDFAVPQEYAPRVKPGTTVMATGELLGSEPVKITVAAVDATVNNDTRNIRVRAIVANPDNTLVPGMSIDVRVPIDTPVKLVAVPSTAIRRAAYGNSVFIITPDPGSQTMRAHQKFVKLGPAMGDQVIVSDGLIAGDRVAAAGSFKLRDGVKVMDQPASEAVSAPATESAEKESVVDAGSASDIAKN